MSNFPGDHTGDDIRAFRAATEAVTGLTVQDKTANEASVREWLEISIAPIDLGNKMMARATFFAKRMIKGPIGPDDPV